MVQTPTSRTQKKPWLILCPIVLWTLLVFIVIWPWAHQIDGLDLTFSILAHVSAFIWWAVLLWALHHLFFQIGSLFKSMPPKPKAGSKRPFIVVLYTTCDDFNNDCCRSCLDQDYEKFSVLICDDSKQGDYINAINSFHNEVKNSKHKRKPACKVIRREDKTGFKAGNINHAIDWITKPGEEEIKADWILLVDADQILPSNYISEFVSRLPQNDDHNIAFLQAAHRASVKPGEHNYFQKYLSPEVSLYYSRDLSLRNTFGFVPLLGHGAMIYRPAWEKAQKFPYVVSEDFAFALSVANKKQYGLYIEDVVSEESFPHDFGGFIVRLKKFAGGTAQLWLSLVIPFFKGPARVVEKWDFLMMLLWYVLMPIVTLNGFLGAYVCHKLYSSNLPYLHPVLPYIYSWMLLLIFTLHISIAQNGKAALTFYFWSTAIYTAAMPVAGWSFIKHLFLEPSFERTPKNQEEKKTGKLESGIMFMLGLGAIACSVIWWSPFSPLLIGQGIAYSSYWLYGHLCSQHSRRGKLARVCIYLPGLFTLIALFFMWTLGRY